MTRRAELERTLEAIFRVQPGFEFDPRVFSPPQLEQYDDVRRSVRARSAATLKVTSRPAGVIVHVDETIEPAVGHRGDRATVKLDGGKPVPGELEKLWDALAGSGRWDARGRP